MTPSSHEQHSQVETYSGKDLATANVKLQVEEGNSEHGFLFREEKSFSFHSVPANEGFIHEGNAT